MIALAPPRDDYRPEEVTVIGGGLSGCLAALFAARVKDELGRPKYHVTLLEGKKHILSGASILAARLHLGGEYPNDIQTGTHCMWGAMLWKLIFPEGIFTEQEEMRFLVAKNSQAKGQAAPLMTLPIGKFHAKGAMTIEKFEAHYHEVKRQYESLCYGIARQLLQDTSRPREGREKIAQRLKIDLPPDGALPSKPEEASASALALAKQAAPALFGPWDEFYRKMPNGELDVFSGHMHAGIATREPGLDIAGYLSGFEPALKAAGVKIVTRAKVEDIQEKPGHAGYIMRCADGRVFSADQIIQAAWEGGLALDGPHRSGRQHKKVQVYRRAMAIVDTHKIPHENLPHVVQRDADGKPIRNPDGSIKRTPYAAFVLKDEHGGMYSPLNEDVAFVYHPIIAHLDETELNSADPAKRRVPDEWKGKNYGPYKSKRALLAAYKKALVDGPFPFLKDAKFVDVIIQPTLNFDKDIDKRRHEPTEEIKPGYHAMYATKLTLAPASAIEAVEDLRQRSRLKEEGRGLTPLESHVALGKAFNIVLRDETYHLADVLQPNRREDLYKFLRERGFGYAVSNLLTQRTPYRGPFSKKEAPENLPPHETQPAVSGRSFGLGFGPVKIPVYTGSGPKTGFLFGKNAAENTAACEKIQHWLQDKSATPLTELLPPETLDNAVYNRLLHADTLELIALVGAMAAPEAAQGRELLFAKENLQHFPAEIWKLMRRDRRTLPHDPGMLADLPGFVQKKAEILATMLPVLYQSLNEEARRRVIGDMALALARAGKDKAFFAPLADPNVNRLMLEGADAALPAQAPVNNGGRSIQVNYQDPADPKPTPFAIAFQGRKYYPVQFHFHRNRSLVREGGVAKIGADGMPETVAGVKNTRGKQDGEFEFKLYRNKAEKEQAERNKEADPNNRSVGELHAIFMTEKDKETGYRNALALCAHVRLGKEDNPGLEPYIAPLRRKNHALAEGESAPYDVPTDFRPLACFNQAGFENGEIPQAPFASLHMGGFTVNEEGRVVLKEGGSDIFYRGVHVVHLPDEQSVTIGPAQLEALENAQPTLTALPARQAVWPLPRADGRGL